MGLRPMISRRQFTAGTAAAALAVSLPLPALPALHASNDLVARADGWRDAVVRYDALYIDTIYPRGRLRSELSESERQRLAAARERVIEALIEIMNCGALCRRDVHLKYHVLDESFSLVKPDLDFSDPQYFEWCRTLEIESDRYDARIHRVWRPANIADQYSRIDGVKDKHAPEWKEVAPWLLYV